MKALFISKTEIARNTVISGNLNDDKIIPFIEIAQDTHVFNYLGEALFNKISAGIIAEDLTPDYMNLLNSYIKPMLKHWVLVEYLPFGAFQVGNGGIFKHSSENSATADKSEVDFLVEKSRQIAQNYTQKFVDFMAINYAKFPEYYLAGSLGDKPADLNVMVGNWYLG